MRQDTPFSHLRLSSEYSITQGLITVSQIVESAEKYKIPSIALTDVGNMFGLVKFFSKCESKGIKPLSGVSLNLQIHEDLPYEILCIAKNNSGHKNLMSIISKSQRNYINNKPVINFNDFCMMKDDLIILSGGKNSHLYETSKKGDINSLVNIVDTLASNFKDNFFIEIQKTNRIDEDEFINNILPISTEKGIPLVATNDVMFASRSDYDVHETKVCINTGTTLNDPNRNRFFSEEQYFKSPIEMLETFKGLEEAVNNANEIAKLCNVSLKTEGYFLPKYPVPESYNFDTFLKELSNKNLKKIIKNFHQTDKDLYQQRLDYELTQINEMGFSSYFLIVYDFIKWSKSNNVPVGPGRGSGAGSLVAFCLGITSLDPIEHGLLFERFLNPERLSMPDFDIDFCMEKRDKVIEYVSNKYGSDAVSQIATFGTMAARAVVRDVCRAMGKPYALGDRIAKMIPFAPGMTLDRARQEQPIFDQSIKNDDEVREIVNMSYKLEGIARNVGKHAGGVVIAPGSISEFCPIYVERQSSSVMTQYDKDDVEKIGLVKFDFLGLRTLTVIDKAIQSINSQKNDGKAFNIENIPLDDQHVFKMLSSGKTMAVFQLESAGMRDLIKRLKPTKFEEITALLALYRPGPLDSGMHDEFVNRKHGKTSVTYPHELLEEVLKETYGVILYQEQVMEAARVLAGFSLGEADILRRAMGKKKVKEMEEQRTFFRDGCEKNNINKSLADKIFDLIEKFAGYGFNKSHSAAYALISYQTAYLKHYYPEHYMAAVLSTELGNTDKIFSLLKECERMSINVISPNILTSFKEFVVNKNKDIEFGLGAIKGASSSFIDHIINIRKNNFFEDLWDFSRKIDIKMGGKKSLEALSYAGAFDSIAPSRTVAIKCVQDMLKDSSKGSVLNGQSMDLFSTSNEKFDPYEKYLKTKDFSQSETLKLEKQSLGYYLSGHPVKAIEEKVSSLTSHKISDIDSNLNKASIVGLLNSKRQIKDRSGKLLTFINFDDGTGSMDGIIGSDTLEKIDNNFSEGDILVFLGSVELDDYRSKDSGIPMYRMRVKNVKKIDDVFNKKVSSIVINVEKSKYKDLNKISDEISNIKKDFWIKDGCKIKIKLIIHDSEAVIDMPDEFSFTPNLENLNFLTDIFGVNSIEI